MILVVESKRMNKTSFFSKDTFYKFLGIATYPERGSMKIKHTGPGYSSVADHLHMCEVLGSFNL